MAIVVTILALIVASSVVIGVGGLIADHLLNSGDNPFQ